jgi:PKD repeat protein
MGTEWGVPVSLNGSAVDPGTAEQPLLSYAWDFGDGSPSASGGASATHTYAAPGVYSATLTACDPESACGTSTTQVVVAQRATVTAYTGWTSSDVTDPATLKASVIDDQGAPAVGRSVGFYEDGGAVAVATAMTDGSGTASVMYVFPGGQVGGHTIVARFAGDSLYTASGSASAGTVTKDGTLTAYTGATSAQPSHTVAVSALLTDDALRPLSGESVTFTVGAQGCTAVTDAAGVAACTVPKLTQKRGSYTMVASFAGTADYLASGASKEFTIG